MKKYISIIVIALCFLLIPINTYALESSITNLTAKETDNGVSIAGTADNMYAVVVQLRDGNNEIVAMESTGVKDGSFELNINDVKLEGSKDYFAYAADYNGGDWTKVQCITKTREPKLLCNSLSMNIGTPVSIKEVYEDGGKETVYKSSNSAIFTIEDDAIVPKKTGSATLSIRAGGKTTSVAVKVYNPTLTAPSVVYLNGKTVTFKVSSGVSTTTWNCSDSEILSLTEKGVAKGIKTGKVTVTAQNNGRTLTKDIYVCDTPKFNAKSIVMNANTVEGENNTVDLMNDCLAETDLKIFDDCGIEDNGAGEVVFKSSNAKIAKIEGTKLIPLKAGSITVTATVDGKSYKLSVKVYDPTLVAPSVVYLNGKNVTFKVSSGVSATAWNCSDNEILSLTEKGVAKGIKNGKVTVTAQNNGRTLTKDIYVCDTPKFNAKSIVMNANTVEGIDNSIDLATAVLEGTDIKLFDDCGIEENGAGEKVFKSSNAKIAKIEGTKLIPLKAGSITVTATVDGKSYKLSVKVYDPTLVAPSVVYLNGKNVTFKVSSGVSATTWNCSDSEILSLTEKGVAKGIKTGKVTVTAQNNGRTLTKDIYVCDTPKFNAKSIVMNANTVEGIDNSIDLATAVLEGTDIKLFDDCGIEENGAGEKVFKSSNAKIAKIEGTKLIPLKAGSITATATVDGKSYKLSVKVYDPTLVAPSVVYLNGKNVTFKVSSGVSATTWNCSDSEILSLTEKGVAKGIKTGKVTVTAQNNGRTLTKDIYVCDTPKFNAKSIVMNANTVEGIDNSIDLATAVLEGTDIKLFDDCGIEENGAGEKVFKSSNAKIAKIEGTKLIPLKAGSITVTATVDGKSYKLSVKVYDPTLVAPSVVYLNGKNVTFKVSSGVSATTWNCSDSEILSLTEKGVAKGIKTGKVTVTAQNNGRTLTKDIYVCDTPKFNAKSIVLKAGEDNTVDLMLSNLEGTDKKIFDDCGIMENGAGEVTFKSSNAKIAKIEGTELIPLKAGSVIVTAKIDGKSYTINVKVIK